MVSWGWGGDQGREREGSALKQTERRGPNLGKWREWRRCSRVLKVPRNMGGLHGRPREALWPHWLFCVQMTNGNGDSCLQTNLMAINQGTWSSSQMNESQRPSLDLWAQASPEVSTVPEKGKGFSKNEFLINYSRKSTL